MISIDDIKEQLEQYSDILINKRGNTYQEYHAQIEHLLKNVESKPVDFRSRSEVTLKQAYVNLLFNMQQEKYYNEKKVTDEPIEE